MVARPEALQAVEPVVQAAADKPTEALAAVVELAALDAERTAAVPALQAAAGPVDAVAQTHKAVGTGVAATDEQSHAPGHLPGHDLRGEHEPHQRPHLLRHPHHKNRRHVLTSFVLMGDRGT
ncbi:regulatory protein AlgP [Escherichia albertii TW07627]|uniref:Regulatory protein AlgP n=1 Tax=Escherichia albertii (strain TW07627) TaxID=502347 RepID=A0ABC9NQS4_ESCAT|nr:regulatory protein AlgP [Escherichia albertii TW07627]